MGRFATGVTVVTALADGAPHGMTANAFMAGSLEPPLCVVSIRKAARLHGYVSASRRYAVSILAEEQRHLSDHFAGRRVAGMTPEFAWVDGMPVLVRGIAGIVADVVDTSDCGDHTLFIGRISRMGARSASPLLFFAARYGRVETSEPIERVGPMFW
ncbi:MAG: flavin reductase [Gammaproteobacteria bacterium]|nr:flavin reductase [Gammaproteobacteria bacterium]